MIPRIIHTFGQLRQSVVLLNPEFDIKIWSKEDVDELIKSKYPWFAHRASSDRTVGVYFVLNTYGGVYIDNDTEATKTIEDLLQESMFIGYTQNALSNRVIGCVPGHEFWSHVFGSLMSCCTLRDPIEKIVKLFPISVKRVKLMEYGTLYSHEGNGYFVTDEHQEPDLIKAIPTVMMSILARNKAHVLPLYLRCLDNIDYPKDHIYVYIHSNDNCDSTESILRQWITDRGKEYACYEFVISSEKQLRDDNSDAHQWGDNRKRLDVLGRIRQKSLYQSVHWGCDYYFVADCDNFVSPHILKSLIGCGKSFVAPVLHCVGDPNFSNFFLNGESVESWKQDQYQEIVTMKNRGLHKVYVAHCTYLVKVDSIPKLSYIGKSAGEWEFFVFSMSAQRNGIEQFVDNSVFYGLFLHFWKSRENEIRLLEYAETQLLEIVEAWNDINTHILMEKLESYRINDEK